MAEPRMPFPGDAPTPDGNAVRAFVVGRFATCSIIVGAGSEIAVVNLFDWEVNVNFDYADATAHGDRWKQKVFLDADWTARARGYVTGLATNQYIKSSTSSGLPASLTFSGYGNTSLAAGGLLWKGACFISRGRISAPMTMMEQEFELVSDGIPSAGLG